MTSRFININGQRVRRDLIIGYNRDGKELEVRTDECGDLAEYTFEDIDGTLTSFLDRILNSDSSYERMMIDKLTEENERLKTTIKTLREEITREAQSRVATIRDATRKLNNEIKELKAKLHKGTLSLCSDSDTTGSVSLAETSGGEVSLPAPMKEAELGSCRCSTCNP